MHNQKNDPSALYQFYRQHRLSNTSFDALYRSMDANRLASQTLHSTREQASATSLNSGDDFVAQLFNRYKNEPIPAAARKELAVDAIMQQVEIDCARARLLATHFKFTSEHVAAETRDTSTSAFDALKSVFEMPGKFFDKLINALSQRKMVLAPAVALAVLTVLVVPKLMPPNDMTGSAAVQVAAVTSVPASMLQQTSHSEFSLGNEMPSMAGFSSASSEKSSRFHLGQIVTHAAAATAGSSAEYASAVSQALTEQQAQLTDSDIANQAGNLAVVLKQDESTAIITALRDLNQVQLDSDAYLHGWFEFGQVMESILISTEIALSRDDLQPLQDSLDKFDQLDSLSLVSNTEPLYRKIAELQQVSAISTLSLKEARQINEIAKSIRALSGQIR